MTATRDVWEEAKRRLINRYMAKHPGVDRSKAASITSDWHEEIGAIMDVIEGKGRNR